MSKRKLFMTDFFAKRPKPDQIVGDKLHETPEQLIHDANTQNTVSKTDAIPGQSQRTEQSNLEEHFSFNEPPISHVQSPIIPENLSPNKSSTDDEALPQTSTKSIESDNESPLFKPCRLSIWTDAQHTEFFQKYPWLEIKSDDKFGCNTCSKVKKLNVNQQKSVHMSDQFSKFTVTYSGDKREIQLASMRKKLTKHNESQAHKTCHSILESQGTGDIESAIDRSNQKFFASTCKVFNTVYYMVQQNRPMSDIEELIELQQKNGVDLGHSLHSRKAAGSILEYLSRKFKEKVCQFVIENEARISVLIDESTTISSKSVLICYIKCDIPGSDEPLTIFLDIFELEQKDAETIYKNLLECLEKHGFDKAYLKKFLIGFCSDGAHVMLGKNSGVAARLKKDFPNVLVWHCMAHRVQLALDDAIKDINGINVLQKFLDNLYAFYHRSPKRQAELSCIADSIDLDIIQICRAFGPRWASFSYKACFAVFNNYAALFKHFSTETSTQGQTIFGLLKQSHFYNDIAIMTDVLYEIKLLSEGLQRNLVSIPDADYLINRTISCLNSLKTDVGKFEQMSYATSFATSTFTQRPAKPSFEKNDLINATVRSLEKRLFSKGINNISYENLLSTVNLLDRSKHPANVTNPWKEGESKLDRLSKLLKTDIDLNEFRDLVDGREEGSTIKHAKKLLKVIAINSAECERGFSLMNITLNKQRNRLSIKTLYDLMTVKLLGKPLNDFDPLPYVIGFLREGHRTADSTQIRHSKEKPHEVDAGKREMWKLL